MHRPAIRQPPFRKDTYLKLLKSVLARSPDGGIPEQDAYFLFDGGKEGLHSDLLRPFNGMAKSCKTYSIYNDDDSIIRRFAKVQGAGVFQLDEKTLIVTRNQIQAPSEEVCELRRDHGVKHHRPRGHGRPE